MTGRVGAFGSKVAGSTVTERLLVIEKLRTGPIEADARRLSQRHPALPHPTAFHPARRTPRFAWWLGGAALAFFVFARITRELMEGEVDAVDRTVLLAISRMRTPQITAIAVDVTALGSSTLVALFAVFALLLLLVLRDRLGAVQLFVAAVGAGGLTIASKDMIERLRPAEAQQLIVVSGFSYPSGHSVATSALYLTIAIIASRYIRQAGARATLFLCVSVVLAMVAASRVYLGVHYATDVVSGISLGAAWALLTAGFFTRFDPRGRT